MFRQIYQYFYNYCIIFFSVLLFVLLTNCATTSLSEQNFQYLYQSGMKESTPEMIFFHNNDSITTVAYNIPSQWCLYAIDDDSEKFKARLIYKLLIFESYEAKKIIDSVSVQIVDSLNYSTAMPICGSIKFKLPKGMSYLIQSTIVDINNKNNYTVFHEIEKSSIQGQNNFYLTDININMKYNTFVNFKDTVIINTYDSLLNKIYVYCFFKPFPIAVPPFSMANDEPFSFIPDSIYTVSIIKGRTLPLIFKKNGIYHFITDTTQRKGYTIFCFNDDFPKIGSPTQMLGPIRYISTQKEFNVFVLSADKKNAIDAFWIDIAGNKDRAKEIIRKYYTRVQDANALFTSYIEGWKTDRGMIYIVLGPPNIVYRTSNGESWIYGESNYYKSYTFNFVKTINPFTNNDYSLIRSPIYKDLWYLSVENWRR